MARFCQHQDTRKQMMMRANPPTTTTSDPFGGRVQKLVLEPVQHPAHHLSLERLAPALRLEQKEKVSVPMSRLNRDGNARSLGWLLCSAPRLNWAHLSTVLGSSTLHPLGFSLKVEGTPSLRRFRIARPLTRHETSNFGSYIVAWTQVLAAAGSDTLSLEDLDNPPRLVRA